MKDLQLKNQNTNLIPTPPCTSDPRKVATDLVGEAMEGLKEMYHNNQISADRTLETALGSMKVMQDVEYRQFKMKAERDGTLTPGEAQAAAKELIMELSGSVVAVARQHGIDDPEAFLIEIIEHWEQATEAGFLERAREQAKRVFNEKDN